MKIARRGVTAAVWAALAACPLGAQAPATAFDVASVKRSNADRPVSNFPLGPGDAYSPNGGLFSATGFPLATYISFAYKVLNAQMMEKLPEWVQSERYDIQARAAGNPGKDDMRTMMRALLAERFKLVLHDEDREVPVTALVVAKAGRLGPHLQPHPADMPCPTTSVSDIGPANANAVSPAETVAGGLPALCGGFLMMPASVPGRVKVAARNVTLDFIAKGLTPGTTLGKPLVDRTGLTGKYDFSLEFTPQANGPMKPGAEAQIDRSGPNFEEAIREQLGLKLEAQKGTITVMVVDHLERPSAN